MRCARRCGVQPVPTADVPCCALLHVTQALLVAGASTAHVVTPTGAVVSSFPLPGLPLAPLQALDYDGAPSLVA